MPFNIGATSAVKDDLRAGFISAEMSDDLSIVPGIGQGKANKAALEHAGIFTPYQLLGQFLLLKAPGMNSQQHLDAVHEWLSGIGIKGQQSLICLCLAEKAKSMMSNIFNAAELDPSNKE